MKDEKISVEEHEEIIVQLWKEYEEIEFDKTRENIIKLLQLYEEACKYINNAEEGLYLAKKDLSLTEYSLKTSSEYTEYRTIKAKEEKAKYDTINEQDNVFKYQQLQRKGKYMKEQVEYYLRLEFSRIENYGNAYVEVY